MAQRTTRKWIIYLTWILLCPAVMTAQRSRPNVLIISVDDMNDWVGYLKGYKGVAHTPNIDRIAAEGTAFTSGHTASTVCCPSRAAIFLGKRPSTTGIYTNDHWWKPAYPNERPLPHYFKDNGYYVAGAGKNFHDPPGNNPPTSWNEYREKVFDSPWNYADWSIERYAINYGFRGPIVPNPDFMPLNGMLPINSPNDWGVIPGLKEEDYGDVIAANYAKDFLRREHGKPFFLSVGIFRPHLPWYVPQKYFDMYPLDPVVLPTVKEDDIDDLPVAGRKMAATSYFERLKKEGKWKEAVRAYLACISFADAQVGIIYDALMKSKYAGNTIVVFWSDHGYHLGTKGHWHKSTLWEESTRVPFIIKLPGRGKTGTLCDQPVDLVNIYPTLISLCGLPTKNDLDGHDLTPLLNNPSANWPHPAISEIGRGRIAVRTKDWRYIRYADSTEELYHRKSDPNEWYNLAGKPAYRHQIEEHRKWLPKTFAPAVRPKEAYFFDPAAYAWYIKETKEYIDGKK